MHEHATGLGDSHRKRTWLLLILVLLLGACLRLWGLGNLGLSGDEEIMGLAVRGILETGIPTMPTGTLYHRAQAQLYLMAASVWLFGQTEWALRLPSVIAGILLIAVAYPLGRRFLPRAWAILFTLVIALYPALIGYSQTARMYIFYMLFCMLFCWAIFLWERTGRVLHFCLAFVAYVVALQFHLLAVFATFLFFLPAITRRSRRLFWIAAAAFLTSGLAFRAWDGLILYIAAVRLPSPIVNLARQPAGAFEPWSWLAEGQLPALSGLVLVQFTVWCLAARALRATSRTWVAGSALVLLLGALAAAALLHHHIALLAFALGGLLYLREGGPGRWLAALSTIQVTLAAFQGYCLSRLPGVAGVKGIILDLLGQPSPVPYVRFAAFFPMAIAVYALVAGYLCFWLVRHRTKHVPDHLVFLLLAVWAPLFLIGFFRSHFKAEYVSGMLPFFVLAAVAAGHSVWQLRSRAYRPRVLEVAAATVVVVLLFVQPMWLWHNVNPKHSSYPIAPISHRGVDHKGAAAFMRGVDLGSADIVIAEDVLQQTYYFGRVDYFLRSFTAGNYSFADGDAYREAFTGAQQLGTAEALSNVLANEDRGVVYVIGSGETALNPTYYVDEEMRAVLSHFDPEVIFTGRDGKTRVLRIAGPRPAAAAPAGV